MGGVSETTTQEERGLECLTAASGRRCTSRDSPAVGCLGDPSVLNRSDLSLPWRCSVACSGSDARVGGVVAEKTNVSGSGTCQRESAAQLATIPQAAAYGEYQIEIRDLQKGGQSLGEVRSSKINHGG